MLPVAIDRLDRQGFATMSPTMMERRAVTERGRRAPWLPRLRQRHMEVEVPLFPGYVLVGFDPEEDPWQRVEHTRGVVGLIKGPGSDLPARVPDDVVEELRARCKAGPVRDPRYADRFKPGAFVKVTEGPFGGFNALVDRVHSTPAQERVWALVSVFGRSSVVEFDGSALEPV